MHDASYIWLYWFCEQRVSNDVGVVVSETFPRNRIALFAVSFHKNTIDGLKQGKDPKKRIQITLTPWL